MSSITKKQEQTTRTEAFLNYLLDIPSKIYVKVSLLIVLLIIGIILTSIAVRQYSPVVHKINMKANWNRVDRLIMDAHLFHYEKVGNKKKEKPQQTLHISGTVSDIPAASTVPDEVTTAVPGDYSYYAKTTMSVSGKRICIDAPVGRWADLSKEASLSGPARYTQTKDGHSITLESYKESPSAGIEFVLKGKDIFSKLKGHNPYIAFNLTFDSAYLSNTGYGWFNFYYGRDTSRNDYSKHLSAPINIVSVYPKPDVVTPSMICFEESLPEILRNGLFIILEDLSMKRRNDRAMFMSSVFLGVVVSFFIQLLVSLISDIRDEKRLKRLGQNKKQ